MMNDAVSMVAKRLCALGALSMALAAGCAIDPGTDGEIDDTEDMVPLGSADTAVLTSTCPQAGQKLRSTCMCGFLVDYLTDGVGGEYASAWGPGSCNPNTACSLGAPISDSYCNHRNSYVLRFAGGNSIQTWWLGTCNPPPCIP